MSSPAGALERLITTTLGDESFTTSRSRAPARASGPGRRCRRRRAGSRAARPRALPALRPRLERRRRRALVEHRSRPAPRSGGIPAPVLVHGRGAGSLGAWDLDGAHRLRGQLGAAPAWTAITSSRAAAAPTWRWRGPGGSAGTGPPSSAPTLGAYPFIDGTARHGVPTAGGEPPVGRRAPRQRRVRAPSWCTGRGDFTLDTPSASRRRVGLKPYGRRVVQVDRAGRRGMGDHRVVHAAQGARPPGARGVEHLDLRFLHVDGLVFSPAT